MTMNTYVKTFPAKTCSLMEAARVLGINKNRACRLASKGWIKTIKLPTGRHLVTEPELERLKELLSGKTNNP